MLEFIATYAIGIAILLMVEKMHQQSRVSGEMARKIIHLSAGLIAISWSFFVSWQTIILGEIVFFIGAAVVRHFKLVRSPHNISRLSWGEFFFSAAVIIVILLGAPRWVFVIAILHLALADSAAALVGTRYGSATQYKVFGQQKSVVGSLTFFVISIAIVIGVFVVTPTNPTSTLTLLSLPLITTLAENIGVYGTDNLLVPLVITFLLI